MNAVLASPAEGAAFKGAIQLKGTIGAPADLKWASVRVSWPGGPIRELYLCKDDCGGSVYSFDATLGPEYLVLSSSEELTLAIHASTTSSDSAPLLLRKIQWSQASTTCLPNAPGPLMIEIPNPNGGTTCIDSTEVTRGQYQGFLNNIAGQPVGIEGLSICNWNMSYEPVVPPNGNPNLPVVGVDWCDAYAYCKWAGKRLCGRLNAGTNPFDKYNDETWSQWYNACSSAAKYAFPYGDTFNHVTCHTNSICNTSNCSVSVGSMALCQPPGPFAGIFDMSGNVLEWEDSCDGIGNCRVRGGAFDFSSGSISSCGNDDNYTQFDFANIYTGFRCCGP